MTTRYVIRCHQCSARCVMYTFAPEKALKIIRCPIYHEILTNASMIVSNRVVDLPDEWDVDTQAIL